GQCSAKQASAEHATRNGEQAGSTRKKCRKMTRHGDNYLYLNENKASLNGPANDGSGRQLNVLQLLPGRVVCQSDALESA
ncbi:hypothetical protein A249_15311, partial [Pseudomonas syringae pv. actinidiae ICMP 18804]